MTIKVLTEFNFHGELLAKLLAEEEGRGDLDVRIMGKLPVGVSIPRTILAVHRTPVVVVIDANSPEPEAVEERKDSTEEVIGDAAGGVPFRIVMAVPALEILFFERPDLVRRVFGELSDHVLEIARLSPRRAIAKLAGDEPLETSRFRLLRAMDDSDVAALRESEVIRDVLDFIAGLAEPPKRKAVSRV